jgi:hypothetical protein
MAIKKEIELDVKVESVGNLKSQLKAAQREVETLSEKFGATSREATEAAKKAAQLKDAIGDAKALTDAFNPDAKFNALGGALQGVAGGFSAVQGAMGLVGVESKDVEATLLKVQSAMALSEGLNSVMAAKDSFTNLAAVIGKTTIGQKLLTAAQVVGAATMRVLNTVMKANPIFLIIAGILAAVAAFKYFSSSTETATEKNDKLNASLERQEKQLQRNNDALKKNGENRLKILQAQGASEEEIHEQTLDNLENEEVARLKNLEFIKQKIKEKRAILKQAYEDEDEELIKSTAKEINDARGKYFELIRLKRDNTTNIIVEEESYAKKLRDKKAESDKKDAEEENKAAEERRKRAEEIRKQKEEADKLAREEKQKQDLEDAKNEEAFLTSAKDRNKNFHDTIRENEIHSDNLKKKIASDYLAYIKEQNAKEVEEEKKKEEAKKQLRTQQVQGVQDSLSIISNLTELFAGKSRKQQERAFKIQKAVNIASAVIDTYKAANAALASAPPPLNFIAMGAAITAGLVNVKKIASQQFQGGGASSGGGGSFSGGGASSGGAMGGSSTVITPNFNIVGNNGQNQLGNLAPVQAFVVSSEMTSQQALDRNRLRNATF